MWDFWKQKSTDYFQMSADPDTCDPVVDPECPSLVQHAIYSVYKLRDIVHNGLYPAYRESDPTTAVSTLDYWLERMRWQDCYYQGCRSLALGEMTPYEVMTICGPVFCPVEFPDELSCAVKRGILIALTRVNMGVIKNIVGINWVIEPLGAQFVPIETEQTPNPNPSACDSMCLDDLRYEIRPISGELPGCEDRTVCNARGTGSTVVAFYGSSCWPAGMPNCIWPGLLAAECIVRSLMPSINVTTNSDWPPTVPTDIPVPINFNVWIQQYIAANGDLLYQGLATWSLEDYRMSTEVQWEKAGEVVGTAITGSNKDDILLDYFFEEAVTYKVRARHLFNGRVGEWCDYVEVRVDDDIPFALKEFTLVPGMNLGNIRINVVTQIDDDIQQIAVYLVPTGVPLNKAVHPKILFPAQSNQTQILNWGDPTNVNKLLNGDFESPAPPPNLDPGFSVANGKLVHAIKPSQAMFSADGLTWQTRQTPYDLGLAPVPTQWFDVCRAETPRNLFVACANGGDLNKQIMTSPDGTVWTARTLPEQIAPNGIAYAPSLDRFVVVGFSTGALGNRGATSTNGITWSPIVSTPLTQLAWRDVTWSPALGLFLCVSQTNSASACATSPDGLTWVRRLSAGQGQWQAVKWCSAPLNMFVAVGNSGVFRIATSTDPIGSGLVGVATAFDANFFPRCLGYSPILNRIVAGGNSGSVRLVTSTDGSAWTDITATCGLADAATQTFADIKWIGDKFVLVTNNRIATSPDGLNWTYNNPVNDNRPTSQNWRALDYSVELDRIVSVSQGIISAADSAWSSSPSSIGDIIRYRLDVESVDLSTVQLVTMNSLLDATNILASRNTAGKTTGKMTLATAETRIAVTNFMMMNSVVNEAAAFKETPTSAPQGFYDLYGFAIGPTGLEGPQAGPIVNVDVI